MSPGLDTAWGPNARAAAGHGGRMQFLLPQSNSPLADLGALGSRSTGGYRRLWAMMETPLGHA